MKTKAAIRRVLEAPDTPGAIRLLSDIPVTEGDQLPSVVTITRTGEFSDPRYGRFMITKRILSQMVENFDKKSFGQDVFIDVAHQPQLGAAAKIKHLRLDGNRLRADVKWTTRGRRAVLDDGFNYLSAEYHEDYEDNETGETVGPTLLGAGLTIRPVIKRLDPIMQLSEDGEATPILIHPELAKKLLQEATKIMNEFLKKLAEQLKALKLHDDVVKQLCTAAETAAKNVGEDKDALKALSDSFLAAGKSLQKEHGDKTVKLSIDIPEPKATGEGDVKTLSADDVKKILADARKEEEEGKRKLTETRDANLKIFTDAMAAEKGLSDETRKELKELSEDLITAEMSEDQVKRFAEHQIKLGNKIEANRQLAEMGYQVAGSPRITVDESNTVKSLQESINKGLQGSSQHNMGTLRLAEDDKLTPFAGKVLAEFDRVNARRLAQEHKVLAGGEVTTGDTNLPASFVRTVIREALSDLNILQIVDADTDPTAQATTEIPFETRDTSQVTNDGVVFEGKPIPDAGVNQEMDIAYINPMKLAMRVTNEVIHFSRSSVINWDAWARNTESNARVIRELVARRIANRWQQAADGYLKNDVASENITAQIDGSTSFFKTANFPVVRPLTTFDLTGAAVGATVAPITVDVDGAVPQWDGTGTQTPGTYWRPVNYNLGYFQLVDAGGAPLTPTATAATISYSNATNIAKVDSDVPTGVTNEEHLNTLIQAVGARKAILDSDRLVMANFLLMSPVLNDQATNAKQFTAQSQRPGSSTDAQGDLAAIKSTPAFSANAPSVDLGDERILLGQRGTMYYRIAKPYAVGQPFEAVDSNGKPTGKKVAYGEEYSAIHVPSPLNERLTSVIFYSATARAAFPA